MIGLLAPPGILLLIERTRWCFPIRAGKNDPKMIAALVGAVQSVQFGLGELVLATRHLSKDFRALKVTDDLSIDLRAGEIHKTIGPNAAGQST